MYIQRIKTTASWRTPKKYMSETPTTRVRTMIPITKPEKSVSFYSNSLIHSVT